MLGSFVQLHQNSNHAMNGSTVDAAGTLQTGFIDVKGCSRVRIAAYVGTTTSTTAFTVTQATDAAGTDEKAAESDGQLGDTAVAASDLPFTATDDGETHYYDIPLDSADLDGDNGFAFISVTGTVTGGTSQDMAIDVIAYPRALTDEYGS